MTFDVAVLPGDGIGPEVVAEAVRVLRRAEALSGGEVDLRVETFTAGAAAWLRNGTAIPASQVVRTVPRGGTPGAAPAITLANVPSIAAAPISSDQITFTGNNTLNVPE